MEGQLKQPPESAVRSQSDLPMREVLNRKDMTQVDQSNLARAFRGELG